MERYSKGFVIFIFTLIFLVIGMGTYIYVDKFVLTEEKTVCDCDSDSVIKDKTKTIVYDNPNYSVLEIPYLNIDSIDAGKINKEFETYFTKTLKLTDKNLSADSKLFYDYYSNINILSVVSSFNINSVFYYKTANISLKNGKRVQYSDLFLNAKLNTEDFYETIVDIYDKGIDQEQESYYKAPDSEGKTVYSKTIEALKAKTIEEYEMYLNDNGELCVIVEEYQPAGSETNRRIMNLNKKTYEKITE